MNNTTGQTNQTAVTQLTQIDEVLLVISHLDPKVLESASQIENLNDRRNAIANHFIDVASGLNIMTRTKSPSTMREKVYCVLAHHLPESKKLYATLGANADVLKTIPNVPKVIASNKWRIKID